MPNAMNLVRVEDLDDPRLAYFANMRDAELAQRADPLDASAHAGLFIAEGELVVRRLIASRYRTHSVLLTPTRMETMRGPLESLPDATPVYLAPQALLNRVVGFNMHRGLLALGERGAGHDPAGLIARPGPLIVLEDVNNHDNLGGVFRCAAALGGPGVGVLLSPRCADPLYRKALRVSIGCVLSVPFALAESWPDVLSDLRGHGWSILALTPAAGAADIRGVVARLRSEAGSTPLRVALVLGAEGPGLTPEAINAADLLVRIPMNTSSPEVDSLNVHVAAAIGLYQLLT